MTQDIKAAAAAAALRAAASADAAGAASGDASGPTQVEQIPVAAAAAAFPENGPQNLTPKTPEELAAAAAKAGGGVEAMMALMAGMMAQMQQVSADNAALRSQMQTLLAPPSEIDDSVPADEEKTYYHPTVGSTIIVTRRGKNGESIPEVHTFWGGRITTRDRAVQRFLDPLTDNGSSPISSTQPGSPITADAAAAAATIVRQAQASVDKILTGR